MPDRFPNGPSEDLLTETLALFQPLSRVQLTREDAAGILHDICAFSEVISKIGQGLEDSDQAPIQGEVP